MNSAIIKVEFLVGTDIRTAAREAARLATQLNLAYVSFKFNGTRVSLGRNCNPDEVAEAYFAAGDYESVVKP